MGDTSETNTKVLYRELFLGVVALKTPIPQNHYLRDKVKSGHILANQIFVNLDVPIPHTESYHLGSLLEKSATAKHQ